MKQYILSIAGAAVIASLVGIITPERWSKYTAMVTGLIIVISVAAPVFKLINEDIFGDFAVEEQVTENDGEDIFIHNVALEMEKRLAADVEKRLFEEFALSCSCVVKVGINDRKMIDGVDTIVVYGDKIGNHAIGRLREIYAVREVIYGGSEKNIQKQE